MTIVPILAGHVSVGDALDVLDDDVPTLFLELAPLGSDTITEDDLGAGENTTELIASHNLAPAVMGITDFSFYISSSDESEVVPFEYSYDGTTYSP